MQGHQNLLICFFSRLKIEELEAERSKLAEENRSLEMKLESLTLQVGVWRSSWRAWHGPCAMDVLTDVPKCSQHGASLPSPPSGQGSCADCTVTPDRAIGEA